VAKIQEQGTRHKKKTRSKTEGTRMKTGDKVQAGIRHKEKQETRA